MSLWSQRKQQITSELDYDPLTVIPGLWGKSDSKEFALKNLETAFSQSGADQIIIVDPYLEPRAIQLAVELFAQKANREVVFLSRLKNTEAGGEQELKTKLRQAQEEIHKKRIFKNLSIRRTMFDFHDRYIVSREGRGEDIYLLVNTSFSTIYNKFSGTMRIKNRSYRRQVDCFIEKAINESKEL
ncbi:hypothetical protein [Vreelandella sulfidaeris]|uniref:hypothetical protein n=1 Tax=Vreelandella sulfidaeris TaxID=115553 RepID=UPI0035EA8672